MIALLPGKQALQLLGKLGGRNRRFLKEPTELDFKSNSEHGMRLILTFNPATSFLVPLDRCIVLASASLSADSSSGIVDDWRDSSVTKPLSWSLQSACISFNCGADVNANANSKCKCK